MDTRYKPTAASLEPAAAVAADIDDLNVSEKWKDRFRIIERAGPIERGKYKNHKALTPAELRKINMNVLAFLFSALFYFAKGMPRKAIVIIAGGWLFAALVTVLESMLNFTAPSSIYWIGPGAVAASLANRDYYLKMVHDKHMWEPLAVFDNLAVAIAFALFSLGVLFATVWLTLPAA